MPTKSPTPTPPLDNQQVVLAIVPEGLPVESDFTIRSMPIPTLSDGQLLLKNLTLGLSPGDRLHLKQSAVGSVLRGHAIAEVLKSRNKSLPEGTIVFARSGAQRYCAVDASDVSKIEAIDDHPASIHLHVLGAGGLTAYYGLFHVAGNRPGETIVVTGATGTVGSIVAQIAMALHCRVVAVTPHNDEATQRWLRKDLGLDLVVGLTNVGEELPMLAPNGIDVVFANVGGPTLDSVLSGLSSPSSNGARLVLCGMISQYNTPSASRTGIRNLHSITNCRMSVQGFITGDYAAYDSTARCFLRNLLVSGTLQYREYVFEGLESFGPSFIQLLTNRTAGTCLVQLAGSPRER